MNAALTRKLKRLRQALQTILYTATNLILYTLRRARTQKIQLADPKSLNNMPACMPKNLCVQVRKYPALTARYRHWILHLS